jgi:flagellar motor switch protein FliN/FliY
LIDRNRHAPHDELELTIELGRARLTTAQAANLGPGDVVALETLVDQPVDILVGGRLVARGEVLELDGNFCIRVTELIRPRGPS